MFQYVSTVKVQKKMKKIEAEIPYREKEINTARSSET